MNYFELVWEHSECCGYWGSENVQMYLEGNRPFSFKDCTFEVKHWWNHYGSNPTARMLGGAIPRTQCDLKQVVKGCTGNYSRHGSHDGTPHTPNSGRPLQGHQFSRQQKVPWSAESINAFVFVGKGLCPTRYARFYHYHFIGTRAIIVTAGRISLLGLWTSFPESPVSMLNHGQQLTRSIYNCRFKRSVRNSVCLLILLCWTHKGTWPC